VFFPLVHLAGQNCTHIINAQTAERIRSEFARAEKLMRDPSVSYIATVCEPCEAPSDEPRWRKRGDALSHPPPKTPKPKVRE
jgi:hypothetical protein